MLRLPEYVYKSNIWNKEPHLIIKGKYPIGLDKRIDNLLLKSKESNVEFFFISRIDLDMEINESFSYLFGLNNIDEPIKLNCSIKSVTQQFGKSFDCLPMGWSVICSINFPNKIPDIIKSCPTIKSWDDANSVDIILSNYTFWQGLKTALSR